MASLEIGYVAGNPLSPDLDRRMGGVLTVIQQTCRQTVHAYQIVTVPKDYIEPRLPVIINLSVASDHVTSVLQKYLSSTIRRPWLLICQEDRFGVSRDLIDRLPVGMYRNAINVRPIVLKFLERIPAETFLPNTITAVSKQVLPTDTP
jgi:hypothetical protein